MGTGKMDLKGAIILLCIICGISFLVGWFAIDRLFLKDSIESEVIIDPDIEIREKNGRIDTVYIYREP